MPAIPDNNSRWPVSLCVLREQLRRIKKEIEHRQVVALAAEEHWKACRRSVTDWQRQENEVTAAITLLETHS